MRQPDPNFVKGYSRQGLAYSSLKQPGPAEMAYRLGLQKDSTNAGLKQGLAALLQATCKWKQAHDLLMCIELRLPLA